MDETGRPENQPGQAPSAAAGRFSTPILVGSMAAAILAVAFIVAIVRGGSVAPAAGSASTPTARPADSGGKAGQPEGELSVVAPIGMAAKEGLSFRWTPIEAAQDYQIIVYDPLMKQIWKSPRVAGDSIEPPERILEFLKVGTPYNWKVTGYTPRGAALASVTHTFRLAGSQANP